VRKEKKNPVAAPKTLVFCPSGQRSQKASSLCIVCYKTTIRKKVGPGDSLENSDLSNDNVLSERIAFCSRIS